MSLLFLLFGISVTLVSGQTTGVSQCIRNEGDLPINTYIHGCSEPPCSLPQLQDCVIDIVFQAPRVLRNMKTLVTAYMNLGVINLPIPYDLGEHAITCNFLTNTYCPLLAGEVATYTLRMFIEPFFPQGTAVTVEFRVVDERNVPVLCLRVPITIAPPLTGPTKTHHLRIEHVYNATKLDDASVQHADIFV
ncbi:uncharacterized protein LOC114252918 [Bombyx mandarina]|uniref:Uncharacterized protein LOC114252918 n=1 Tax=Bombyx mandarina TaxID=7092 RepID=A0A6J2KTA2_BOMMA|nr:uncharacterized protein LOC114252918 [Bombyx mandarina]